MNPIVNGEFGTTKESKAALEGNALEVLEKIEEFNGDTALEKIIELAEFLNTSSEPKVLEETSELKILNNTLTNISALKSKELDIVEFNAAQANAANNTLQEDFNEETGIYTYYNLK